MQAIRIIVSAAKAYYEELLFFCLAGAILCVTALLIIPLPFAMAGISMIAHRAVRGLGVSWELCWKAVKEYGPRSFWLTLILACGYLLLAVNVWFYVTPDVSPLPDNVRAWIAPAILVIGLTWMGVTFYAHAFLIELESPKLTTILRNSLSLTFIKPLPTLILLIVALLATVLSIAAPLLLVALPGFLATLSITAMRTLLAAIREKYGIEEEEEPSTDRTDFNGFL